MIEGIYFDTTIRKWLIMHYNYNYTITPGLHKNLRSLPKFTHLRVTKAGSEPSSKSKPRDLEHFTVVSESLGGPPSSYFFNRFDILH